MNKTRRFNIIMVVAVAMIAIMSIGYALFASTLTIGASGEIKGKWGVAFNTESFTATGSATDKEGSPSVSRSSVQFNVDFAKPGDSKTYVFTVENTGNIDAILEEVNLVADSANSPEISFEYTVKNGNDIIVSNTDENISSSVAGLTNTTGSHTVTVTITYVSSDSQMDTSDPNFATTANYTLNLTYVQASAIAS